MEESARASTWLGSTSMTDSENRPGVPDASTPSAPARGRRQERPLVTEYDERSATLSVTGGVFDDIELEDLQAAVVDSSDGLTRTVTVDLSETDFFPSRAVGAMVAAMRGASANDATLRIVASAGSLAHRVLSVSGLPVVTRG